MLYFSIVFIAFSASAKTVYKTVDTNGVVTFTDIKPAGDTYEVLDFVEAPTKPDPMVAQRRADMALLADKIRRERAASSRKKTRKRISKRATQQLVEYRYYPTWSRTHRRPNTQHQPVSQDIQPPLPRRRLPHVTLIPR
ncbi:MAG: DUF4124 domain-containing protein [Pseudomonadota bacterium]